MRHIDNSIFLGIIYDRHDSLEKAKLHCLLPYKVNHFDAIDPDIFPSMGTNFNVLKIKRLRIAQKQRLPYPRHQQHTDKQHKKTLPHI
ncbi:MAG: hypothetical protein QM786_13950 [Breznakibacter sp.]